MITRPTRLRIEHGPRALGIGFAAPRLSWWLPQSTTRQTAYRVEATVDDDVLDSGAVATSESILQPWPFPALGSRARVAWRVSVETDAGWSDWSDWDHFETGLLDLADWRARFIGDPDDVPPLPPRGERGARYFRRAIEVD